MPLLYFFTMHVWILVSDSLQFLIFQTTAIIKVIVSKPVRIFVDGMVPNNLTLSFSRAFLGYGFCSKLMTGREAHRKSS
jgi:hypothetical protein